MIRHDTVVQNPDPAPLVGLGQHPLERRVVGRLRQQRQPGHRAVEHVIDESAGSHAGLSR